MAEILLTVEKREHTGKQESKRLRRAGRVPGVFYIHGQEPVPFSVDEKQVHALLGTEASVLDLKFGSGKKAKCVVREIQWHPLLDKPIHLDLMGVKMTEEIQVEVPIHLVGEAIGVKQDGGILQQNIRELSIQCLPGDIPDHIEIDISDLAVGDTIHVSDIKLEKGKILSEPQQTLAVIVPPRVEAAPVAMAEEEEGAEPEVVSGKKEEEAAEEAEGSSER